MFALFFILWLCSSSLAQEAEPEAEVRMLTDEEVAEFSNKTGGALGAVHAGERDDNFGDLVVGMRNRGDMLLWRETLVNDQVDPRGLNMLWSVDLGDVDVNHVRALNFGRQRGIARRITVKAPGKVEVLVTIRGNHQIRMMVEIYCNRAQK